MLAAARPTGIAASRRSIARHARSVAGIDNEVSRSAAAASGGLTNDNEAR